VVKALVQRLLLRRFSMHTDEFEEAIKGHAKAYGDGRNPKR
jgi:hypothetical protein